MTMTWVCQTCEREIEETDIDAHEDRGHEVRGLLVPDRLLANDPWRIGDEQSGTTTDDAK